MMRKPTALTLAFGAPLLMLGACSEKSVPPIDAGPERPKMASPSGPSWKGGWSKEVRPYPTYPVYEGRRAWSHHEIAQRHQTLLMKELPTYITELRGGGAIKENGRTSAAWFFTVPREHIPDFEQYLFELGIPREAFHKETYMPTPPGWTRNNDGMEMPPPPPNPPATRLIFLSSNLHKLDGSIMGMFFPHEGSTMFSLDNPNIARASIVITFNFLNGNTQIGEKAANPDIDQ